MRPFPRFHYPDKDGPDDDLDLPEEQSATGGESHPPEMDPELDGPEGEASPGEYPQAAEYAEGYEYPPPQEGDPHQYPEGYQGEWQEHDGYAADPNAEAYYQEQQGEYDPQFQQGVQAGWEGQQGIDQPEAYPQGDYPQDAYQEDAYPPPPGEDYAQPEQERTPSAQFQNDFYRPDVDPEAFEHNPGGHPAADDTEREGAHELPPPPPASRDSAPPPPPPPDEGPGLPQRRLGDDFTGFPPPGLSGSSERVRTSASSSGERKPKLPIQSIPDPEIVQGAQQLSVGALAALRQGSAPPPEAHEEPPPTSPDDLPDYETYREPEEEAAPKGGGKPDYAHQGFGQATAKLDREGVPAFVPTLPEPEEDAGATGRRAAACAWMLFAMLGGLTLMLLSNGEAIQTSIFLMGPMFFIGILMLTGTRWSGILGIVFGILYGLGLLGLAFLTQIINQLLMQLGASAIPDEIGLTFLGVGLCFLIGTLMMLVRGPGMGRASAGVALVIVPQIAATVWLAMVAETWRPKLTNPVGGWDAAEVEHADSGVRFRKPEGWAAFEWPLVHTIAPVARGLTTEPVFHFLNRNQDMMLAVYIDQTPRLSLTALMNPAETMSRLETEVTHDIPRDTSVPPESFRIDGVRFTERQFEGITSAGTRVSILLDRADLGDRVLLMVLTRDRGSSRASDEAASAALNAFLEHFRLRRETPES